MGGVQNERDLGPLQDPGEFGVGLDHRAEVRVVDLLQTVRVGQVVDLGQRIAQHGPLMVGERLLAPAFRGAHGAGHEELASGAADELGPAPSGGAPLAGPVRVVQDQGHEPAQQAQAGRREAGTPSPAPRTRPS